MEKAVDRDYLLEDIVGMRKDKRLTKMEKMQNERHARGREGMKTSRRRNQMPDNKPYPQIALMYVYKGKREK